MKVVNCSAPERFQPAGYWASQGLETEEQVRFDMLWQAVSSDNDVAKQTLEHAEGCDYCGDVLDRFRSVAYALKPGNPVNLAICPAASELFDFQHNNLAAEVSEKVSAHVKKCSICSGELQWLSRAEKRSLRPVIMTPRARMITLVAVAATVLIGSVFFATVVKSHNSYIPIKDTVYSTRYHDLGRLPLLDREDLMKASPLKHWTQLDRAMSALELNDTKRAVGLSARLINDQDDAAAEYVLGRGLYREHLWSSASEALLKSERMTPQTPYRCWTALQIGLLLGDKETILRECKHLENNPDYGERVKNILNEVQKRG